MNKSTKLMNVAIIAGLAGIIIVGIWSSWMVALGVFLMLFGNNLEKTARKIWKDEK